jgi:hypothetical protein
MTRAFVLAGQTGDLLAIAPSGMQLAVREPDATIIVDRSGRVVSRLPHVLATGLAFADDSHLVAIYNGLSWITDPRHVEATHGSVIAQVAAAGGRAISAFNSDLVVSTPAATQYLGYDVDAPALAQPAADGQLLIGLAHHYLLLDRTLRVAATPSFALGPEQRIADLRWLGDDACVYDAADDDGKTSLVVVVGRRSRAVRGGMATAHVLMYEPSTRLLTLSLGASPAVYRFDPATIDLVRVASVPDAPYVQTELVPVAPACAGGVQLVRITMRDRTSVEWIPDPAHLDRAASKVTFTGAIAGVDAAGRAYAWESSGDGRVLAVYRDGTLPAAEPVSLWPDPQGTRIAEVGTQAVTLVGADGTVAWTKQLAGASQVLWLADGALAVISVAGIARIDPATGNVTAARCGWGFGASAQLHPPAPRIEPACAQLEPGD